MIKISERLRKIAYYAENSSRIADVGTDHAYLPIYLAERSAQVADNVADNCGNVLKTFVLTDVNEGPLTKAKENVSLFFPMDLSGGESNVNTDFNFSFRIGDGLIPLAIGEVETAIIAGMGGELIVKILSEDLEKTESIDRYILQPRTKCDEVREWISSNNYSLLSEDLALERGRVCEIIVFSTSKCSEKSGDNIADDERVENSAIGEEPHSVYYSQLDYLLDSKNPLFEAYLEQRIKSEEDVLSNIGKSKSTDVSTVTEVENRSAIAKERIRVFREYMEKVMS